MFTPVYPRASHDRALLRAARMAVQHHPTIPAVRPASDASALRGRIISTQIRNIAPAVAS